MSMKNRHTLLAAIALGITHGYPMSGDGKPFHINSPETDEQRAERLAAAERSRNIKNGLKEFVYEKASVWALNKKNADRKYKKLIEKLK